MKTKRKNKLGNSKKTIVLYTLFIFTFFLSSLTCQSKNKSWDRKTDYEIIFINGCNEDEITQDLENSSEEIKDFLVKNGIKSSFNDSTNWCGYILRNGSLRKEIKTVITSMDLVSECKKFFKIKRQTNKLKNKM